MVFLLVQANPRSGWLLLRTTDWTALASSSSTNGSTILTAEAFGLLVLALVVFMYWSTALLMVFTLYPLLAKSSLVLLMLRCRGLSSLDSLMARRICE